MGNSQTSPAAAKFLSALRTANRGLADDHGGMVPPSGPVTRFATPPVMSSNQEQRGPQTSSPNEERGYVPPKLPVVQPPKPTQGGNQQQGGKRT